MFIIILPLIGCGTIFAKKATEPITYSEQVNVSDSSQEEVFFKVKNFFDDAFKRLRLSNIQLSDENSGIIKGKFVVDGIQHADQLLRYNSNFTVEANDGFYQITFTEPTIQDIGFISEQAKENAFQSYIVGYKSSKSAMSPLTSKVLMPSNSNLNRTDAEIRRDWEKENVFSSTNPSPERPAQYDYQAANFNTEWLKLATELKIQLQ